MDNRPDIRCIDCRSEFLSTELSEDISCCPTCGSISVPANPRQDQVWALSMLSWQLLVNLALEWEEGFAVTAKTVPILSKEIYKTDIINEHGEHPVVLSPHEIRTLTWWASNAQNSRREYDGELDQRLERVLQNLRDQSKERIALTFEDDIESLRDAGYDVEVRYGEE